MSLLGNLFREITKTASNVGEALVDGAADITEAVTGPNQLTKTVRKTGVGVLRGAKSISDQIVATGEELFGLKEDDTRRSESSKKKSHTDGVED